MVEPNTDEKERAMGFPIGTTNVPGILKQQWRFLLGQAMDSNCLTWIVSLLVAKQKWLASIFIRHMGFYELRSPMEPPTLLRGKVRWLEASGPQQLIYGTFEILEEFS
jgi:hypothetical protein